MGLVKSEVKKRGEQYQGQLGGGYCVICGKATGMVGADVFSSTPWEGGKALYSC